MKSCEIVLRGALRTFLLAADSHDDIRCECLGKTQNMFEDSGHGALSNTRNMFFASNTRFIADAARKRGACHLYI